MSNILMTETHKSILQKNVFYLKKNLSELDTILDILYSNEIFNEEIYQLIKAKVTYGDRICEMVHYLSRYSDKAYDMFLYALQESNQTHIITEIDPTYLPSLFDDIDSSPEVLENINIENLEMIPMNSNLKKNISSLENYYNLKEAKCYGRALIINNIHFQSDYLNDREGAEKDKTHLISCFKLLHYNVKYYSDLTANEIINTLQKEAANKQHLDWQSLVVCVMSHGVKNGVYGVDGEDTLGIVTIQQITNIFNGENCEALTGKPKLFFIQACQINLRRNVSVDNEPIQVANQTLEQHPRSDIFIFTSSVPGEYSWRHYQNGTLFIKALMYSIFKLAHQFPITTIANKVKSLVCKFKIERNGAHFQMPITASTLTKDFYFMP